MCLQAPHVNPQTQAEQANLVRWEMVRKIIANSNNAARSDVRMNEVMPGVFCTVPGPLCFNPLRELFVSVYSGSKQYNKRPRKGKQGCPEDKVVPWVFSKDCLGWLGGEMKGKSKLTLRSCAESLGESSASSLIRPALHVRAFNQVLLLSCCRSEWIKAGGGGKLEFIFSWKHFKVNFRPHFSELQSFSFLSLSLSKFSNTFCCSS